MNNKLKWQVAAIVTVGSTITTLAVLYVVKKVPAAWVDQ